MRAMDAEISADYAAATGGDAADWLARMRRDKGRGEQFGADQARELRLVDEVAETVKPASTRVDAQNQLTLLRLGSTE